MTPAVPTIVIGSGPRAGERVELDRELTVGREDADISISDSEASRRHAVFRPVEGGVEVVDLGSTNGTSVDGGRVDAPRLAGHGSTIQIGTTSFKVELPLVDVEATRQRPVVTEDFGRTAVRAGPEPASAPSEPTPPAAAPPAAPAPSSAPEAGGPPPGGDAPPPAEAAPAEAQPPAPPAPVRAVLGFLFGAGPEKIKVRMLIFVLTWTSTVAALTVLIYTLVS